MSLGRQDRKHSADDDDDSELGAVPEFDGIKRNCGGKWPFKCDISWLG